VVEIRVWSWLLLLSQVAMAMDWIISSRTGNVREDPSSDRLVRVTTKTGSGSYDGIDGVESVWVIEMRIGNDCGERVDHLELDRLKKTCSTHLDNWLANDFQVGMTDTFEGGNLYDCVQLDMRDAESSQLTATLRHVGMDGGALDWLALTTKKGKLFNCSFEGHFIDNWDSKCSPCSLQREAT